MNVKIKIINIIKSYVLWLLILCLMLQLGVTPQALASEKDDTITILFTNDMHSNFLPYTIEQDGTIKNVGGYARLKSAIDIEKTIDPEALLLDAGDFSMGTPFQTIFTSHASELRLMGRLGYDVITLGNHEFDYRAEGLADSLKAAVNSGEPLPQLVQSNTIYPVDKEGKLTPSLNNLQQAMNQYGAKEYTVIERKGIKIGIFGLLGKDSASKAPMSEVEFADEIKEAKRVVKILKEQEGVDLIICLSHSGTWENIKESEDEILAKQVPEIDVIISGHTHTKLTEPIVVGKTIIGSSEENGLNLGVITVSQDGDLSWKLDRYELIPVGETLPEDKDIAQAVAEFKEVVQNEYFDTYHLSYDEVVAYSPFSFPTEDIMEDNHEEALLGNLISDAYIYAVKQAEGKDYEPVTAAIVPIGTIRGSFSKGPITTADAYSISSLGMGADKTSGYPLISVYLTGKELKTVCEVDASVAPIMSDAQLYIGGMTYTFNPNRLIFNKVTKCSLVNTEGRLEAVSAGNLVEIEDDKLYRVAAGLYSAQMLSVVGDKSFGLLTIVPKTKEGVPITDFEAQIIYTIEDGKKNEVKEWSAIVSYLKSFEPVDGVPTIPMYYSEVQGRKVVDHNKNILALISRPNGIALAVYGLVIIIITLIVAVTVLFIRRMKKRRRKI